MKFYFLATALLISSTTFAGSGTSVGNGGHGVDCHGRAPTFAKGYKLLDFVLAKTANPEFEVSLDARSVRGKVDLALSRLPSLNRAITQDDVTRLQKLAHRFLIAEFIQDTTDAGLIDESLFAVEGASIPRSGFDQRCEFRALAVKPNPTHVNYPMFAKACDRLHLSAEECVYFDTDAWHYTDRDHRAGLIVHETLRFLPARTRPRTISELRRLTARLCGARN